MRSNLDGQGAASSPPPGGGRSARASGPGGGDSASTFSAYVVTPSPHPGLPSAVRPSPLQGRVEDASGQRAMTINPITVEVVRNAVIAYGDEMANALCKAAYNMMIYEVRDYCCGLIDTRGRMISQNRGGLPIFLADLGVAVEDGIDRYGLDGFAPGDVVIMNHGEVCGQHLNNIVIYAPCFHDGKVVAFAASRAHWVDIGGMRVGFGSVETTEIYQEGLQFRSLKIYEAGRRNEPPWQIIHDRVRFMAGARGARRSARPGRCLPAWPPPLWRAARALWVRRGRGRDCGDLGQHGARGACL